MIYRLIGIDIETGITGIDRGSLANYGANEGVRGYLVP